MFGFIEKLTLDPQAVTPGDAALLRAAGISDAAVEDAVHVCALFSIYDRLADAFGFHIPDAKGFAQSAARLLKHGYV